MKTLILFCSSLFFCIPLFAENFDITGIVKDSKTNKTIPYVNVAILHVDSTSMGGAISNEEGKFYLNKPKSNDFLLSISCIGYENQVLHLKGISPKKDLGILFLHPTSEKLDEIKVHADNRRFDKQLYFPSKKSIAKSTNGLQLTRRLLLPEIIVSEQSGSISMSGTKELKLLINGVEATAQEILALNPKEVLRVDYYDNPGLRYGTNVGVIIDYKTKKITSGGYLMASMSERLTDRYGYDQVSGGLNFKKSQLKYNYTINHNKNHSEAVKKQKYHFPNGNSVVRTENTDDYHWNEIYQNANVSYNYSDEKDMLSVKLKLMDVNQPHIDSDNKITSSTNDDLIQNHIRKNTHSIRPSMDVYYFKQLKNKQSLAFNVVGTYSKNKEDYHYVESTKKRELSNIISNVDGERKSLIAEIFYEKQFSEGSFTSGIKYTVGNTCNKYSGSTEMKTDLDDRSIYGFIQYSGNVGKLGYMGAIGLLKNYFSQRDQSDRTEWNFTPKLNLNYKFNEVYSLQYTYQLSRINPSLSHLSDVIRPVNKYQSLLGNPELKTYLSHQNELKFCVNKSAVNTSISVASYLYKNPIMEESYFDQKRKKFITTYDNQKSFHMLNIQWSVGTSLFNEHVSINGYLGYNYESSKGDLYEHSRRSLYYVLQAVADYKKFAFTFTAVQLSHPFWGETVSTQNSYNEYLLTYEFPWGQVGVSSMNLFGEKSTSHSYTYNKLLDYDKRNSFKKQYPSFEFYFSFNLNWGKEYNGKSKNLNNSDDLNGVL